MNLPKTDGCRFQRWLAYKFNPLRKLKSAKKRIRELEDKLESAETTIAQTREEYSQRNTHQENQYLELRGTAEELKGLVRILEFKLQASQQESELYRGRVVSLYGLVEHLKLQAGTASASTEELLNTRAYGRIGAMIVDPQGIVICQNDRAKKIAGDLKHTRASDYLDLQRGKQPVEIGENYAIFYPIKISRGHVVFVKPPSSIDLVSYLRRRKRPIPEKVFEQALKQAKSYAESLGPRDPQG
jgi:hypothetical protein